MGTRLPTEAQLMERFQVGRQTVRHALADLAAGGLVKGHQGLGSTVLRQREIPEYSQSLENIGQLMHYARNTREAVLRIAEMVLDEQQAAIIGTAAGERWCCMDTLRCGPSQPAPMALSSVWVPAAHRKAMRMAQKSGMPVFMEIQRNTGYMISKVNQVIGASLPAKEQAKLLKCGINEPLLRIQRWYYLADDTLIEMSDTLHPPARFQYAMTLRHATTTFPSSTS
jgi:DNA-binding GntR family transcriptional regulator